MEESLAGRWSEGAKRMKKRYEKPELTLKKYTIREKLSTSDIGGTEEVVSEGELVS